MDRLNRPEKKVLQVMGTLFVGGAETMMVNVFREIDRQELSFDFLVNGKRAVTTKMWSESLGGRSCICPRRAAIPSAMRGNFTGCFEAIPMWLSISIPRTLF